MMTLDELLALISAVDRRRSGCAITITTINVPPGSRGHLYGYVTVGSGSQFAFHSETELREILETR